MLNVSIKRAFKSCVSTMISCDKDVNSMFVDMKSSFIYQYRYLNPLSPSLWHNSFVHSLLRAIQFIIKYPGFHNNKGLPRRRLGGWGM